LHPDATAMGVTMLKLILAGLFVAVVMAGGAAAGPLDDGQVAYSRGDFTTALKLWRPLAEQGIAAAQYDLGLIYHNGQGVPRDYAEAMSWYRKAAEQGYADGQFEVGSLYANGRGVPQDYTEAMKWYRLAAERGNVNAQYNLGSLYEQGEVVPRNYSEAAKWYLLAAAQSNAPDYIISGAREHLQIVEQRLSSLPSTSSPKIVETPEPPDARGGATIKVGTITQDERDTTIISIEGELRLGDEKRFADAAIRVADAVVVLSSPGGNVFAGIEIGKAIRLKASGPRFPRDPNARLPAPSPGSLSKVHGTRRDGWISRRLHDRERSGHRQFGCERTGGRVPQPTRLVLVCNYLHHGATAERDPLAHLR
jgi:hypothetical protein